MAEREKDEVKGALAPLGIYAFWVIPLAALGAATGAALSYHSTGQVDWGVVAVCAAIAATGALLCAFLKIRGGKMGRILSEPVSFTGLMLALGAGLAGEFPWTTGGLLAVLGVGVVVFVLAVPLQWVLDRLERP